MSHLAWLVFAKEWRDAMRDRRTLLLLFVSAVAMGPLMLVLLSSLVSEAEQRAQSREIWVAGIANGPSLVNYLERQTYTVTEAPARYEDKLQSNRINEPVLRIGPEFEADLARGEPARVEVLSSSANTRADAGVAHVMALLQGFSHERAVLRLALRGVSPAITQALRVQERDLAQPAARSSRITAMLPFFVLMAVLYGAMTAALDTTAGERERGSLEPLLMNPAPYWDVVLGKWAAVAAVSMLIASFSSISFLSGQWLLRSEALAALFHYGWQEVLAFILVLLPLAGALAAVLMAVAIRGRTVKEAQAGCALLVMGLSLLPLISLFSPNGEQRWHLLVPGLAQSTLMARVLKGEALGVLDLLLASLVCLVLWMLAMSLVVRQLHRVMTE